MKSLEEIDLTKPYSVTMDAGRVVEAKNLEPVPEAAVTLEYAPMTKEPESDMNLEDLGAIPSKARTRGSRA